MQRQAGGHGDRRGAQGPVNGGRSGEARDLLVDKDLPGPFNAESASHDQRVVREVDRPGVAGARRHVHDAAVEVEAGHLAEQDIHVVKGYAEGVRCDLAEGRDMALAVR